MAITGAAVDDRTNITPTPWWIYTNQTLTDVNNTIAVNNARIIDLDYDHGSGAYTVVYVSSAGAYAKAWWWLVNVDQANLSTFLSANNARIISLKVYNTGSGPRFWAVMISNTGADAKTWYWYYNQTPVNITNLINSLNTRLVQIHSYQSSGQTYYAVVMISNTGADSSGWYWFYGQTPADISNFLNTHSAFLYDLDRDPTSGNFNVIMLDRFISETDQWAGSGKLGG